jgi:hypothetical protein
MGILAEDGDEADTLTLRKLAEQVCWYEWGPTKHLHAYMIWL